MQIIDRENLEIGKLYYIKCMTEDNNHNIIPNKDVPIMIGIFKKLLPIYPFGIQPWNAAVFSWFDITKMKYITCENDANKYIIRDVELNSLWRFYEVKKFRIQKNMEYRAVNLLLQKIIGDQYFIFT
jgi:hypothetical protein